MDEVVSQLLSYQTVILMVAATIITWIVRKSIETLAPTVKKAADEMAPAPTYLTHLAAWWNEVGLHLIPVGLGVGLVFGVKELAPLKMTTTSGIALYGGICGWFSSTGYKILRRTIKTKTGVDLPSVGDDSVPPPPMTQSLDTKKAADDEARKKLLEVKPPSPTPPATEPPKGAA